jgi:DNA repair protein RadC
LTRRLVEAGVLLGVEVLDHIIVGDGRYYSFNEVGCLCL